MFRSLLLTAYRLLTRRERASMAMRFRKDQSSPGNVLFYHRVADTHKTPWTISRRNFRQHLDWLESQFPLVTMDAIMQSQRAANRSEPMVHITFDDGYQENCEFAIPELQQRGIPFTYFVTTSYVESGAGFPHDVAHGLDCRPNTIGEIQEMAKAGVEIGAHTHTHLDLGKTRSPLELQQEIGDVRKRLQDWTGQSIRYFAFPYGMMKNMNQAAIDAVFEAGFESFVSAYGGMNRPGDSPYHIRRIHGDPGIAALKNWLTFDPRKVDASSFPYRLPLASANHLVSPPKIEHEFVAGCC